MRLFLYLTIFVVISFFSGCGCDRDMSEEQSSSNYIESNSSRDEDNEESIIEKVIPKERTPKPKEKKRDDTIPPPKAEIVNYSKIEDGHIRLIVKGEIDAKVYIESMFYGVIGLDQRLEIKLESINKSYFETFEIVLSDKAGNESIPLFFTTTFQRESIDGNYTYYLPNGVNFLNHSLHDEMIVTNYQKGEEEVISLIMPIKVDENQTAILKLNPIVNAIEKSHFVSDILNISQQELDEQQSVVVEYALLTTDLVPPSYLLQTILFKLGKDDFRFYSNYEEKKHFASTHFNIKVTLFQKYENEAYLSIAVVANRFALKDQGIVNSMINSKNIRRDTTPIYMEEQILKAKFIDKDQEYANFLFVIDDSGSMYDYQKAISQTAKEFALAIKKVGMNFRVAIITTGDKDEAFDILETYGVMENDTETFRDALKVGTDGSQIETAIYNAELALASKKYGDKKDGLLTKLEMPKVNKNLSIIILSDEPSNYEARAKKKFDIENNLFVNRGYRVYLIGSPQKEEQDYYFKYLHKKHYFKHISNAYGTYGQLAKKTGGLVGDIHNIYHYDIIMNSITQNILGDLGYKLTQHDIIESTIYVTVNEDEVPKDNQNGWRYIQSTNSILFSGVSIPNEDDTILVRYGYSLGE